ncbi:MAG: phage tail family protein [Acidobacterium ailaaui]|nr:phage tail family protein [Pseudacidobacterium ailaaui]
MSVVIPKLTNGFTFNGRHSSEFPLIVNSKPRQIAPPISPKLLSIPGRPGAYDYGAEIGTREITIGVSIFGDNSSEYRSAIRQIAAWLLPLDGKPKQLIFDDEPDKYYLARLSGQTDLDELVTFGSTTLTFLCADPHAYSIVSADEVTWGSDILTFDSMTYVFGDDFPNVQQFFAPGTFTITSYSTVNIRPTINIYGSAGTLTITSVETGKSMTFPRFMNKTWIIDGDTYTISATNDDPPALSLISGDFIEFMPGTNNIQVSGSGLNVSIYVNFRDKFL